MKKRVFIGVFVFVCACLLSSISVNAISRNEAVSWAKAQVGTVYNVDGIYGYQCSDFGTAYINYILDGNPYSGRYTTYMGYKYFDISYPSGWQRIANTADFVPQPGDILCFGANSSNSAGHVAVAIEGCTTSIIYGVGQNGAANGGNGEAVKKETIQYFGGWGNFQGVIRPKFSDTTSQPSQKTTVTTDKSLYNVGETVKFTFSYKYTTSVSLGIDKDGSRYATPDVTGKASYSMSFSQPGTYTVYVSGWSQSGYEDSPKVTFTVGSGVSKADTWIKADKTKCYASETVNFTFSYKYTTSVSLGIDKDGKRYANPEVTGKTSYSYTPTEPGIYSVYVSGWSQSGYEDSGRVYITVQEKPVNMSSKIETYTNAYIVKTSIANLKRSAVFAVAMYSSEGKMLDIQTSDVENGVASADIALVRQEGAAYVKVFLWNSLSDMQPLTETETIKL